MNKRSSSAKYALLSIVHRGHGAIAMLGACAVLVLLWAGSASAQNNAEPTRSAESPSAADDLFYAGKRLAGEHQWQQALQNFERSWQLKPSYDTAGNLGHVALKLGLYTKAATFLDRCLQMFPATGNPAQRTQVEALLHEALPHVAAVRFKAAGSQGSLLLDRSILVGAVPGDLGPIYLHPGTHVIQVQIGSRYTPEQSFLAVAGAALVVQVSEAASEAEPAAPRPADTGAGTTHEASRPLWPVFVGAGVTVSSLVFSAILFNSANSAMDAANDLRIKIDSQKSASACFNSASAGLCGQLHDEVSSVDRDRNWGYALVGVGSISALATAAYLLWPTAPASEHGKGNTSAFSPLPLRLGGTRTGIDISYSGAF